MGVRMSEFKDYVFFVTETYTAEIKSRGRTASEAAKLAGVIFRDSHDKKYSSFSIELATRRPEDYKNVSELPMNEFLEEFLEGIEDYDKRTPKSQ